jgi:hypothetical protein
MLGACADKTRVVFRPAPLGLAVLLLAPLPDAYGKTKPPPEPAGFPLEDVAKEATRALDDYEFSATTGSGLPGLVSAEFDFKGVVDTTVSAGLTILVFKFGGSQKKEITTDDDFTYIPEPVAPKTLTGADIIVGTTNPSGPLSLDFFKGHFLPEFASVAKLTQTSKEPPKTLHDELLKTLRNAGLSIKNAQTVTQGKTKYDFCQLQVTVAFGITTDLNAAGSWVFSFVTPALGADFSDNRIQTVKLTFKNAQSDKLPACPKATTNN